MVRPGDVEALLRADPVCKDDLAAALRTTKPSSDGNIIRYNSCIVSPTVICDPNRLHLCDLLSGFSYQTWQNDYGSV